MDKNQLCYINCDLCGKDDSKIIFENVHDTNLWLPGKFNVVQCKNCGLNYVNPQLNPELIQKYYPEKYGPYKKENSLILKFKKLIWSWEKKKIHKLVEHRGNILEIGCARGDFLNFIGNGYNLYGIEMDEKSVQATSEYDNIKVWRGKFEEFNFPNDLKFDLIILFFVLEHLPSVRAAFKKMTSIIAPNGKLLISVPNYNSWDRVIFGKYWNCLDVPRHYFTFTESTIKQYAKNYNFDIIGIKHSAVPNDWIEGLGRLLGEMVSPKFVKVFNSRNRIFALFFLPLSGLAALFRKSSRVTFIMMKI